MDKDQEPYGEEQMAACIASGRGGLLDDSVSQLLTAVEDWCRPVGPLDDVTILGVEWKP